MASLGPSTSILSEKNAAQMLRLALVLLFLSFGLHKFSAYEAEGIAPMVVNSPFTSWLGMFGTQGASNVVGVSELLFGLLLAVGFWRPGSRFAIAGAIGSVITFLTTLSFMLTTPGVFSPQGAPILSGPIGQFLIKDIVLLAASILLLVQSLSSRTSTASELASMVTGTGSVGRGH